MVWKPEQVQYLTSTSPLIPVFMTSDRMLDFTEEKKKDDCNHW